MHPDVCIALHLEAVNPGAVPAPMVEQLARARQRRGTNLRILWDEIDLRIARYGTNPAGVLPEALEFSDVAGTRSRWTKCYQFSFDADDNVISTALAQEMSR